MNDILNTTDSLPAAHADLERAVMELAELYAMLDDAIVELAGLIEGGK